MDSWPRIPSFAFLFHLLLLLCPLISASAENPNSGTQKVSLQVYYESLCPDSVKFIVDNLIELFEDGFVSIVDLRFVPYGNARLGYNSSITCQHGPNECFLNTVEACAINAWPELTGHFPFIYCVEAVVYERKFTQWDTCFEKLGLNPKPIYDCYSSALGKELELQYAAETNNLQPPHKYVPWVVVDGKPLYESLGMTYYLSIERFNGATTTLELIGTDRVGLLSEEFVVIADLQCDVVEAKVWTHNGRIASLIYVKDDNSSSLIALN